MRDRLIELLQNFADGTYASNGRFVDNTKVDDVADYLLANGVTVQEWISVKDRLPKEHRLVLCRWTRGIGASYGFARYNHDNDVWYVSNEGMPEVTHWMPLPQPPKGE